MVIVFWTADFMRFDRHMLCTIDLTTCDDDNGFLLCRFANVASQVLGTRYNDVRLRLRFWLQSTADFSRWSICCQLYLGI
ncbi:hypothetical protein DPMN_121261 [Dreissena polymorpha]|uniref:Uncharacterized protein n=1 Tax=Dreissena polymorpha TaxID=45954 RepID=A0A9D4GPS5_DREPO|nr:hypothetical protein DPMN_121261 [Dreissena polymorpha]